MSILRKYGKKLLLLLKWLLITVGIFICIILIIPIGMTLLGYRVNASASDVAALAAKSGNVALCKTIMHYGILGPPTDDWRNTCIYEYAKLAKDASACELLLPSEYGMSCISAAVNFPQQECISTRPNELVCYTSEKGIQSIYSVPQIENCLAYKKYNNHQVIHWCYGERARKFGSLEACLSDAAKGIEKDDCYYQRAMKVDDLRLDLCNKIQTNDLMRKDCLATVAAWLKYPSLRPSS